MKDQYLGQGPLSMLQEKNLGDIGQFCYIPECSVSFIPCFLPEHLHKKDGIPSHRKGEMTWV